MHRLIKFLNDKKLIHVCGIQGIGKTRYVAETAYYMHVRSQFRDGIFMFDLAHFKTAE